MRVMMIKTDRNRDTPRLVRALKPDNMIGTRYADFIRASGHAHRVNTPDT